VAGKEIREREISLPVEEAKKDRGAWKKRNRGEG
jgi:hypothetical protein